MNDAAIAIIYALLIWFGLCFGVLLLRGIVWTIFGQWKP